MTKIIASLSNNPEETSDFLKAFEKLSQRPGVDLRLTSELIQKRRQLLYELGMDASDTNSEELYHALAHRMRQDDANFIKSIGLKSEDDEEAVAQRLVKILDKKLANKKIFAPKRSIIKKILKSKPPKNAQKLLHYRSIESMLRRSPIALILAAADATESKKWHEAFQKQLSSLEFDDYEERSPEFIVADAKRWSSHQRKLIMHQGHGVYSVASGGGVVIVPAVKKSAVGQPSLFLIVVVRGLIRLRAHATYNRHRLVVHNQPGDFGVLGEERQAVTLSGYPIDWHYLHRLMHQDAKTRELFEPHIGMEHLEGDLLEQLLPKFNDVFRFWVPYFTVGISDKKGITSAHILDVVQNVVYDRPFGHGTHLAMQDALTSELHTRYLAEEPVRIKIRSLFLHENEF